MTTFNELLNQAALSVLDTNQQSAISQQQNQMLQNSLVQVRREIAALKSSIETQEKAFNPVLELKETLIQKQKMEQEIWVEIQKRELFSAMPSTEGRLTLVHE
ncbi:hypothetical protein LV89_04888 [Arcicella aurantiaca]|uniref:Uncharacterized protein n=1 Tax=Arcicella aurantiaca TaxID=591202 RepID=A0A316DG44_9BACT|nr:hypothetical protein [Arcicella aurantiaca]PWK16626.1 hypothetical protein LV89_04888 [Arcicella aurantiaca]